MSTTILCAVDISNENRDIHVLQEALRLAGLHDDAQLDVITVLPDYGTSWVGSFFEKKHHDQVVKEAKKHLNALVQAALGSDVNAKVRHIIATGTAYEEILKTAKLDKSDLIVIGAHKPDFKDYLLGPNAARVVRHSRCSVFVVR
ncbi:universal stress protein [Halocynthiibacter sp. C4]|uniref:universal stress protein n=1 Tax=Halocynthiibacter sp. C4 TaxID=2992758 RepID=UPI00237B7649|nr:universal stress protein [Halocynthiibacter sp. C4]MDE0588863.1 universal stress protein [Halocynthiibacter sp. C4]